MLNWKKNKVVLLVTLAFAFVFAVQFQFRKNNFNAIKKISIEGHYFDVEIVEKKTKLEKGLGGRESLCEKCGMLFNFSKEGRYAFWMKDMRFPLDIIWTFDKRIVHVEKNVKPDFSGTLNPDVLSDAVLEVRAGTCDEFGFKPGAEIIFQ